jgi:hypothetical protein
MGVISYKNTVLSLKVFHREIVIKGGRIRSILELAVKNKY